MEEIKNKIDVLIFAGQSNMQGSTGEKAETTPVENCYEYKFLTDSIVPLASPVGEDVGKDVLWASASGNGSLVPYFCGEYVKKGGFVLAIHVAKGNTTVSEWQKGTERFEVATDKIKKGLRKVTEKYEINKIFVIWLQGESDALNYTGTIKYSELLTAFKNDLKKEVPFAKFCIIQQGYFAAYAEWDKKPFREKKRSDKEIMKAFDIAEKQDGDFVVLTRVCKKLSIKKKYLNPAEHGPHYNNAGMKIIGRKAARALRIVSRRLIKRSRKWIK